MPQHPGRQAPLPLLPGGLKKKSPPTPSQSQWAIPPHLVAYCTCGLYIIYGSGPFSAHTIRRQAGCIKPNGARARYRKTGLISETGFLYTALDLNADTGYSRTPPAPRSKTRPRPYSVPRCRIHYENALPVPHLSSGINPAGWNPFRFTMSNGPLVDAGSNGDKGQTGRKLVMDYHSP